MPVHALPATSTDKTQGRLLLAAALFLVIYATVLTLSPAARTRTWSADLRWSHWVGVLLWVLLFGAAHFETARRLPQRDPYLLPIAALLSGWGLLTIWRLSSTTGFGIGWLSFTFGERQAFWLAASVMIFLLGLRLPTDLAFLRQYKYVLLTTGLLLTALTLLFGTNPSGSAGPRLWLGAFGLYLQPSEPLKLLLIVYLAGYLSGITSGLNPALSSFRANLLPLLAPTLVMTGLALLLLVIQQDLGTASIFIFLYAVMIYLVTGRKAILALAGAGVGLAGAAGYLLFDVVRVRVDAWLNPWLDPSGRSYQIVQALITVANGGLVGRGPGLGNPGLVPVPHSDFIFTAIAEEMGLIGVMGLILLIALLVNRGLRAALKAPDPYRRYLAAGLTAHLAAQSILIIGGNVRLLPLTGVTLPFVSYGGSSLVTSFVSLALLLHISGQVSTRPLPLPITRLYLQLGALLLGGLAMAGIITGWWGFYRAPGLLTRTDNARRVIADRFVLRGSLLDRSDRPLVVSLGKPGDYTRTSLYPPLSQVTGYTDPIYGQSGLEASLDPYLRGLTGYPSLVIWQNHLLYGMPPEGLDVRTTLDLELQMAADELLGSQTGALVLLQAETGEVLAMTSHPGFDPTQLSQTWDALISDPRSPLLNRASLGQYSPGPALVPFLLAEANSRSLRLALPADLSFQFTQDGQTLRMECALQPAEQSWAAFAAAGCPGPAAALGQAIARDRSTSGNITTDSPLLALFQNLGLYTIPQLRLEAAATTAPSNLDEPGLAAVGQADLRVSPLQMALAAATLSANGVRPAPSIASSVDIPGVGWSRLAVEGEGLRALSQAAAQETAASLQAPLSTGQELLPIWQMVAVTPNGPNQTITWYLAGTLPGWNGSPLALALILETDDPNLALKIGQGVFEAVLQP